MLFNNRNVAKQGTLPAFFNTLLLFITGTYLKKQVKHVKYILQAFISPGVYKMMQGE
jgi:hypothetical protein